jgi:hypothetical protein
MANDCLNNLVVQNITAEEWEVLNKSFTKEEFPATFVPEPNTPDTDWRCENWGTKRKVYDVGAEGEFSPEGIFEVFFSTAWAPINERCLSKVSKAFPSALFTLTYYEENEGYVGVTLAKSGIAVDKTTGLSEVQNTWQEENKGTISELTEKHQDEDDLNYAIDELWHESKEEELDKLFSTYATLLTADLDERLKQSEVSES